MAARPMGRLISKHHKLTNSANKVWGEGHYTVFFGCKSMMVVWGSTIETYDSGPSKETRDWNTLDGTIDRTNYIHEIYEKIYTYNSILQAPNIVGFCKNESIHHCCHLSWKRPKVYCGCFHLSPFEMRLFPLFASRTLRRTPCSLSPAPSTLLSCKSNLLIPSYVDIVVIFIMHICMEWNSNSNKWYIW